MDCRKATIEDLDVLVTTRIMDRRKECVTGEKSK